ncbi:MAG: ribonuclease HIII [Bacillus subtilis]|nr:ribonuclease HIII [Bacillus subtilis]
MTHVFTLDESQILELIEYYAENEVPALEAHVTHVFVGDGFRVTVYKTNKVLFQGEQAGDEVLMWSELLGIALPAKDTPTKVADKTSGYLPNISAIGSDEVGTGDYFGPVVVCAAFVRKDQYATLLQAGVKDSKKLTDEQILKLGAMLRADVPYQLVVLPNPKYNEMIEKGFNLNKIKAYLHNHAIRKQLQVQKEPYDAIIVDQFTPKDQYFDYLADYPNVVRNLTFYERAESVHPAVAAASIIARHEFLLQMDQLSEPLNFHLPLGAGPIVDLIAKRVVLEKGVAYLSTIAKVHFKNHARILESVSNKRP